MGRWKPAQWPKEEPEVDEDDPVTILEHREWVSRRKQVEVAKAQLIREKLRECYIKEGVNHIQNCKQWVEKYRELIQDIGSHRGNSGMLHKAHYGHEDAQKSEEG